MNDKYKIPYMHACVRAFSKRLSLTAKEGFNYLLKFQGIAFLEECYEAEHLLSLEDAVDDLIIICRKNGGHLE